MSNHPPPSQKKITPIYFIQIDLCMWQMGMKKLNIFIFLHYEQSKYDITSDVGAI